MSGCDIISPDFQCSLHHGFPFYITVTCDAGIRGSPCRIFFHEIVDDLLFELSFKVHDIIRNLKSGRNPSGIIHGTQSAATAIFFHRRLFLILPDLHRHTDHAISLFFQKICGHRRIHATRHSNHNCFLIHFSNLLPLRLH